MRSQGCQEQERWCRFVEAFVEVGGVKLMGELLESLCHSDPRPFHALTAALALAFKALLNAKVRAPVSTVLRLLGQ